MSLLKLSGGTVYDPRHNIDGEVRDLWVQDGRMIAPPTDPDVRPDRTLDVRGMVVMPGGVDMHCHIAGPKVNAARKMRPEEKRVSPPVRRTAHTRSGTTGSVPSTFATGYLYADWAIPPLRCGRPADRARHVHEELHDTPSSTRASTS